MAFEFQADEMHSKSEFVSIQHSVSINVRELPDLAEDGVGQLGLDQFGLGRCSSYLAVDWVQVLHTTANHSPATCWLLLGSVTVTA